jgi:hypothetical protein
MREVAGRIVGGGAQELRRGMTLDVAESAQEQRFLRGLVRSAYQRAAVSARLTVCDPSTPNDPTIQLPRETLEQ